MSEKINIICSDKRKLSAIVFPAKGMTKAAILVACATGMRKEFYASFCEFLSDNGYSVLCFDFRGVGESALKSLKEDPTEIIDWGVKDMPAALDELIKLFPNTGYHLIGHSAGGQLTGLMYNNDKLTSQFNFASSTGQVSNLSYPFKLKGIFFLKVFIPLSNVMFGYTKLELVKMGASIPKRVGSQWSKWCSSTGYVKASIGKEIKKHYYDKLNHDILWLYAADDTIANARNVKSMVQLHSKNSNETKEIIPQDNKMKSIGHMGFFKKRNSNLWREALDWLAKYKK